MEQGRSRKLTEKALQEKLQRHIALRKHNLGALTSKIRDVKTMKSYAQNLQRVKEVMENDFALNLHEFSRLNSEVANLLADDEKIHDQKKWFEPKMASITNFMKETKKWIADVHESVLQKEKDEDVDPQDTVEPNDSVSQVEVNDAGHARPGGSQVSSTSSTTQVSSTRIKQEAEHAALLERVAAQKKRQQLELEMTRLKVAREELELETALAESSAKIKVKNMRTQKMV